MRQKDFVLHKPSGLCSVVLFKRTMARQYRATRGEQNEVQGNERTMSLLFEDDGECILYCLRWLSVAGLYNRPRERFLRLRRDRERRTALLLCNQLYVTAYTASIIVV